MRFIFSTLLLVLGVTLTGVSIASAQYVYNFKYNGVETLSLDDATAQKGYTIESFDNQFRFGITPNVLTEGGTFEFKEVELLENSGMEIPTGYKLVSKIVEFDIKNKDAYDPAKPFWLQMKFDSDLEFQKFLFYFDSGKGRWIQLPSTTDLEKDIVKAAFHLPYAKLAVFDTDVMKYGKASWYAYKDCMCAASPDYPKGSQLLVSNLNADEAVVVTVNDWGPERDIFPDRVIDLDAVVFKKFGTLGIGVLQNMHVTPYIAQDFTDAERAVLESGGVLSLTPEHLAYITDKEEEEVEIIEADAEISAPEEGVEEVTDTTEKITVQDQSKDEYYFLD